MLMREETVRSGAMSCGHPLADLSCGHVSLGLCGFLIFRVKRLGEINTLGQTFRYLPI